MATMLSTVSFSFSFSEIILQCDQYETHTGGDVSQYNTLNGLLAHMTISSTLPLMNHSILQRRMRAHHGNPAVLFMMVAKLYLYETVFLWDISRGTVTAHQSWND